MHALTCTVSSGLESQLVVQALRVNTLSKLTFADSKRFDSLVQDVFVGVPFKDIEYLELDKALRDACQDANLVVIESQVLTGRTLYTYTYSSGLSNPITVGIVQIQ